MKKLLLVFVALLFITILSACKPTGLIETPVYTVEFSLNNGSTMDALSVDEGSTITEPTAPTKEGYTFAGWYSDSALTSVWTFATDTVTEDITLYAKWTAVDATMYTVSFDTSGGTAVSSVQVAEGNVVIIAEDPTKEGYTFGGWYLDSTMDTPWDVTSDMVSSDMTLYAKWNVVVDYTETFKVLSIGNSFSEDAQRYLWSIAESYGIAPENIIVANMYIGGCSLATHVSNMLSDAGAYQFQLYTSSSVTYTNGYSLSQAMAYTDWDVVTLQQVSSDSGMPLSYSDYVESLVSYVQENATNEDVQIYWHMTWAYQQTSTHTGFLNYSSDQMTMYQAIVDTVAQKILTNSDIAGVIPSGTAVQNARTSYIGDLFTRDGYHLSDPLGRYIAGLMFFKEITGFEVSPSTIEFMPTGVSEMQQELAMEAVNFAYQNNYQVTSSTYTTEPEPEEIEVNGIELEFDYVQGFWNADATDISPTTDALHNSFAAVMPISKAMLPVGSEIVIAEGYQYRIIFFEKTGEDSYHVVYRTILYTSPYVVIDETLWGNYDYIGFNITTNPMAPINDRLDEVVGKFHLYYPEGTGEGHVDTDLTWTSGLWEVGETELTDNVNYISTNPLTPAFYDYDTVVEVEAGYKFAYVVLSYNLGEYTVESVSAYQTDPLYIDAAFADGKELLAFIVTSTNEDVDVSAVDMTTVITMHPQAVPHIDAAMNFISGYWESGKHEITTTNTNMDFLNGFAASQPQSKEYYQDAISITVEAGYQVRVIYLSYDGFGQYTVMLRSDYLTGTILLDETFWGDYEYIAFNIASVPSTNLSSVLETLPGLFTVQAPDMTFNLGYWAAGGIALTSSTSYAGSNPISRQVLPVGTTITIADGYQVRVIFFTYDEVMGYTVVSRTENYVGQVVLSDALYQDYQYVGFNISTAPTTTDLTSQLSTLYTQLTTTLYDGNAIAHVDEVLSFTSGYWNNYSQVPTTGDTAFILGFAASNVLSKESLQGYSELVITEGYQVRVIYLDYSYNAYTVLLRTDNLTGTITLDSTFWGDYEYVAFNISSVPSSDLSTVLETLPGLLTFVEPEVTFELGYWAAGGTSLTASSSYAGSNVLPRESFPVGTTIEIADGYQVRVIFLSYEEGVGYTVVSRTENFIGQVVLTDGLYMDYQYIAFNISTAPSTTDLTGQLDNLVFQLTKVPFDGIVVEHLDETLTFTSGYWNNFAQEVTTGDTSFILGFAASNVLSKHSLDAVSEIVVEAGYQVRVIYLDYSYNTYTVMLRTDNLTGTIVLDETFWGDYEYVAFNISSVPSTDLSTVLETLPGKLEFVPVELSFSLGYWASGGTALTTSTSYAGSNIMPRDLVPLGTTITIEAGYQVRVVFFTYTPETGYVVAFRSENFINQAVLTNALFQDYDYVAFTISTAPSTSDLTAVVDTLPTHLTFTPYDGIDVAHVDEVLHFVSGYWNTLAQEVTTGDTTFINGFAASNVLSRTSLATTTQIVVAEGYQVRVIFMDYSFNTYTVQYRTDNLTGTITLDETFWGDYQYVAFNISSVPSSDLSTVLETLPPLLTFVTE